MDNQWSRRKLLAISALSLTPGITGCQSIGQGNPDPEQPPAGTEDPTETPSETPTATPSQPYSATDIRESGTLNLMPADDDAEYADSIIFEQYNGDIDVELDLEQALNQRHYENPVMSEPVVEGFYKNAYKESWRQRIHEQYLEAADGENILGLQEEIDWEVYENGDNIDERIEESGIQDLWYKYAIANPDLSGISSVHNGYKAAAYQGLDQKHGFQTFYWDHDSAGENGDHGLVAATEKPTRDPEKIGQQQNYTIETNQGVEQEIATVAESNFFQGDNAGVNGYVEHPAEHDYNNKTKEKFMYTQTAMEKWEADLDEKIGSISETLYHTFTDEWFRNPTSEPAFNYFDRMNAVAYMAEENGGMVHHTENEMEYRAGV